MKTRSLIRKIASYVILFLIIIVIFCMAMIISYALPNERIQFHIRESKDVLAKAGENPFFGETIKGAQLDGYTDLLIMNTAMNKGKSEDESILIRAFENSRYSEDNVSQYDSLVKTIDNKDVYNNLEYSRYWHGIQTIVRPLLLFFNYEEIRYIFMLVMFILLMIATILICRNLSILHALSFMFSMLAVNFFIIPMSMQYIGVFAVMLIAVILVNILFKLKKEKFLPYLFFIIGGCTTFFDLLTAPLITLGIPLLVVVLLRNQEKNNVREVIIELIKLSILWGISYVVVFATKWVIASIVLQQDMITLAINQVIYRTNGASNAPASKLGAIWENIKYLYNMVLLLIEVLIGIIWIVTLVKRKKKKIKGLKKVIPLLFIALYPYIWYVIVAGHSTIHAFYTYRIQAITIFAVLCAMIECVDSQKVKKLNSAKRMKE